MTFRYGHSASGHSLSMHGRAEENAGDCADKFTGKCVAGLGPQPFEGTIPSILRRGQARELFPYPTDGLREGRKSETNIPDTGVDRLSRRKSAPALSGSGVGMLRRCKSQNNISGTGVGRLSRRKTQNHHPGAGAGIQRRYKSENHLPGIETGYAKASQIGNLPSRHWSRQAESRTKSESLFGTQRPARFFPPAICTIQRSFQYPLTEFE